MRGKTSTAKLEIDMQPPVSVYATYRRLSYKPWYAVAEFVDNSTQNYFDHKEELLKAFKQEGERKFHIDIVYNSETNKLEIRDNANGMNYEELTRAVILNKPPKNTDGRCEYGMGLKTAACWFGDLWAIKTKRLGDDKQYKVKVSIQDLEKNLIKKIPVHCEKAKKSDHYTLITIERLHKPMKTRTLQRIRDQLSSMFRQDLRSEEIEITWNGVPLEFEEPPILEEAHKDGTKTFWKKIIKIKVPWEERGLTLPAAGWIGIRMPGSQRDAGFVLFRRGRVVVGGPESGYKPPEIFGQGNTFRSQRLIGEFNLNEWPVSHSKDMFDWSGGLEDNFIEELKKVAKDYMDKCEGIRKKEKPLSQEDMRYAGERTQEIVSNPEFGRTLSVELTAPAPPRSEHDAKEDINKLAVVSRGPQTFRVPMGDSEWVINIRWQDEISTAPWMELEFPQEDTINVFLNSAHPFFSDYLEDGHVLELLMKLVVALALAEKISRQLHGNQLIHPDYFRTHMNRVLHIMSTVNNDE